MSERDPPSLSPAAEKLLERVSNPRNWYAVGAARTPRAMQELVEAGLVRIGSRMLIVRSYYVPTSFQMTYRERYHLGGGRTYEDAPTRRSYRSRSKV